jgi:hypothetical protein
MIKSIIVKSSTTKWVNNHIDSFVIEVSVAFQSVRKISVGLLMGVSSTYASQYDFGKLISLDCGSFGSPSFAKKTSD